MKKAGLNPYLPFWEHVPDGEPHVFGDRIYIYGSHDGGHTFCEKDYVCWSAPVDDPGNWKYEGVSYRKEQDPINGAAWDGVIPPLDDFYKTMPGPHCLYAPDVCQGPDGRYYLYYSLDFSNLISVAVANHPAGPFQFLAYVTGEDGSVPEVGRKFDPAILSEESGNWLYYGFAPQMRFPGQENAEFPGAMVVRLADDMHTIISEPKCVAFGCDTCAGTDYEAHPFFEASSIRHFGDWYYFVYSSLQGHELCYGMAKSPTDHFDFKGVIISNGDFGYEGRTEADCFWGNNHGGLVQFADRTWIFYHRQSGGTEFNRQGCAEQVKINEDGTIDQVEITSCGLNDGPLPAVGRYASYIACNLTGPDGAAKVVQGGPGGAVPEVPESWPYITDEECLGAEHDRKPYIRNLRVGAAAGFKYFSFTGEETEICMELRGEGAVQVHLDAPDGPAVGCAAGCAPVWKWSCSILEHTTGVHALLFTVLRGTVDFAGFTVK